MLIFDMQQKVEETQREKEELVKKVALLQQEKEQLESEKENLTKECEQEKEACAQLRRDNQVRWGKKKSNTNIIQICCNLEYFFPDCLWKGTFSVKLAIFDKSLSSP